jgi:hypothetical protein
VVPRQNAARFPELCPEPVRDCPSASAEKAWRDAFQPQQVPQLLVAQKKLELPTEPLAVALLAAAHRTQKSAAPRVTADESVSASRASSPALAVQRASQKEEQRSTSQRWPEPALSVRRAR